MRDTFGMRAVVVFLGACSFSTDVANVDAPPVDAPRTSFIFEAEAFTSKAATATHDWTEVTTIAGYSGTGYLILTPDNSAACGTQATVTTCAASVVYNLPIEESGTYYIYARLYASTTSHDSVWFGVNGVVDDMIDVTEDSTWRWVGGTARMLPAGAHQLSVWQREGARFDVIAVMPTQEHHRDHGGAQCTCWKPWIGNSVLSFQIVTSCRMPGREKISYSNTVMPTALRMK